MDCNNSRGKDFDYTFDGYFNRGSNMEQNTPNHSACQVNFNAMGSGDNSVTLKTVLPVPPMALELRNNNEKIVYHPGNYQHDFQVDFATVSNQSEPQNQGHHFPNNNPNWGQQQQQPPLYNTSSHIPYGHMNEETHSWNNHWQLEDVPSMSSKPELLQRTKAKCPTSRIAKEALEEVKDIVKNMPEGKNQVVIKNDTWTSLMVESFLSGEQERTEGEKESQKCSKKNKEKPEMEITAIESKLDSLKNKTSMTREHLRSMDVSGWNNYIDNEVSRREQIEQLTKIRKNLLDEKEKRDFEISQLKQSLIKTTEKKVKRKRGRPRKEKESE